MAKPKAIDEALLRWVLGQVFSDNGDDCDEIEAYNKMCKADPDECASDYHSIWQTFETWDCGSLISHIDSTLQSLDDLMSNRLAKSKATIETQAREYDMIKNDHHCLLDLVAQIPHPMAEEALNKVDRD